MRLHGDFSFQPTNQRFLELFSKSFVSLSEQTTTPNVCLCALLEFPVLANGRSCFCSEHFKYFFDSSTLFFQDCEDTNPLIRALAVRTMGCIRVDKITEYLCEPLRKCLKDEDPYVRKTAAVCVAKLYDISSSMVRRKQGRL